MYLYSDIMKDLWQLAPRAQFDTCGASWLGKGIPYVVVGSGRRILIHGGIHAREWVTSYLVMEILRGALDMRLNAQICFIPCVNPDGIDIAQLGTDDKRLIDINRSYDFSTWKANANAVDINVNFDANWGSGAQNITVPASANYIGAYAGSEPETQALMDITHKFRPELTISYHALGREVYWEFFQTGDSRARDKAVADSIAQHLHYRRVDGDLNSAGGYKDWCIQKLGISALTIEVISDTRKHPLCQGDLAPDIKRNIDLLSIL